MPYALCHMPYAICPVLQAGGAGGRGFLGLFLTLFCTVFSKTRAIKVTARFRSTEPLPRKPGSYKK